MHGIDERGKAVLRRTVSRGKVMEVMAGIGPCLVVHRVRKGLVDERTALINQLRGLLSEFGIVMAKGRYQVAASCPSCWRMPATAFLSSPA